jgi:hypothetical protein
MSRRGGRPKRRSGDYVVATIEFPLTIEFPTEQAAVDLVARTDEIRHEMPGADCACSFVRAGRQVTIFPENEDHAREIAIEVVRKGWAA